MYLITRKENDCYTVMDSTDLVEEEFSREDLLNIIRSGITVYGTNEFCLEYDVPCTLIIRLYGEERGVVKDYDGYLLRDYCVDYDNSAIQILDAKEEQGALLSFEVWSRLLNVIRDINPKLYNIDKLEDDTLEVGYKALSVTNLTVDLLDYSDNTVYTCDFHTCLFIYFEENKRIEGLNFITLDDLSLARNNDIMMARCNLDEYYHSSMFSNANTKIVTNDSYITESYLSTDWDSINQDFMGKDFILMDLTKFPLFNLRSNIRKFDYDSLAPTFLNYDRVVAFEGGKITFANGNILEGLKNIVTWYKVLLYDSDSLKKAVNDYVELQRTKSIVLKNGFDFNRLERKASNLFEERCIVMSKGLTVGCYIDDLHSIIRTRYGMIEVHHSNYLFENKTFRNLWMLRVTHTGSCWFDFNRLQVVCGSMTESNNGNCICNDFYVECIQKAEYSGISYHNDLIIPLCVASYNVAGDETDIRIVCLIRPDEGVDIARTAINVVSVPLLFLGGNLIEYNDCYCYKCLFQTIFFEKSVIENLSASFDENDMSNLWESVSRKNERILFDHLFKSSTKALKSVLD